MIGHPYGLLRRAFSVLWVVERSRSQRHRAGVVGPYHRHHHRSNARGCLSSSQPEP